MSDTFSEEMKETFRRACRDAYERRLETGVPMETLCPACRGTLLMKISPDPHRAAVYRVGQVSCGKCGFLYECDLDDVDDRAYRPRRWSACVGGPLMRAAALPVDEQLSAEMPLCPTCGGGLKLRHDRIGSGVRCLEVSCERCGVQRARVVDPTSG